MENLKNKIFQGDCLQAFKLLQDESVDLVIADPPYFGVKGSFDFDMFKDVQEYIEWSRVWLLECKRVLKKNGTLILWGGVGEFQINIARLAIMIEDEKIFIRKNWVTQRNSRGYGTQRNYMSAREDFLFLVKGKEYTFNVPYTEEKSNRKDLGANGKARKNTFKRVSNVFIDIAEASQSSKERCAHPTVKAQKLCDRIINTHSNESDFVFIPFVGSGSEIVSAIRNNRTFFGSEISAEYVKLAKERIQGMTGHSVDVIEDIEHD